MSPASTTIRRHEFVKSGTDYAICLHCAVKAFARILPGGIRPHETISAYVIVFNKHGDEVIPSRVRCKERPR